MITIWFVMLFVLFAVSVLTLTYIQTRVAKYHPWQALRKRPLLQTYWTELSVLERFLFWPGVVMFFITLIAGSLSLVIK
jgi:hypothetical protein